VLLGGCDDGRHGFGGIAEIGLDALALDAVG
jgi:hypothetical protein